VPIYLITNLPAVGLAWTLVATTLFFVASNGRIIPAMTMATSAVPMRQRGGFMSVNASVQSIGSGLAALIGGLIIREHNGGIERYEWVGYFAIAMSFVGIYLASQLRTAEERASEALAAGPTAAHS
jgi:predicted MFS family arabinose efflux permease